MILKNKKAMILSSLATLLPMLVGLLLWDKLPETMPTHWGIDGQPDGWSSTSIAVFVMPLILLAVYWLCIFVTIKDPGTWAKNPKPIALVLWIIPLLSNLCCGLMYAIALDADVSVLNIMTAAMGLMFVAIGNYLPKCKMNATIGIKICWTYTSEENWNATHRFGGKVWFIGGLLMLATPLMPGKMAISVFLTAMITMVIIPIVYSWLYYRKQLARGDELKKPGYPNRKASKIGRIVVALILIFTAYLMFSGNIEIVLNEESFTIEASWHDDLTVAYDSIDTIEYREGTVDGYRLMGYASARLLLGTFENEEFGRYTRYTYTHPESCIVLTSEGKVLVFCGRDAAQTLEIYNSLNAKLQ